MVPVNLRPLEDAWKLGNRFGLVPLVLPSASPTRWSGCLRCVRAERTQGQLPASDGLRPAVGGGLLIKPVQHAMLNIFAKKATAVMTNVPGPAQALSFCGSTVEKVMFWVPQSGDIGMGVSILTYAGKGAVRLDHRQRPCAQTPRPSSPTSRQFERLLWLALMLPWGEDELS